MISKPSYLYSFNYEFHFNDLCKLESRQLFNAEEKDKLLFTDVKVDPTISPFIKNRLEIILSAPDYTDLLSLIRKQEIRVDGFTAEYLKLEGDQTDRTERRKKLHDVGYCIEGEPDFNTPKIIYAICKHHDVWYFGLLIKQNNGWYAHLNKPHSFSNSIDMKIAKSLVGIAAEGSKSKTILDACCGVGTVLLEGCFAGFDVTGNDINPKAIKHAQLNLAHYGYSAQLHCSDIKDFNGHFDGAIIDLPYNLFSHTDDEATANIIAGTAKLSSRIIIVSITDIESIIVKAGLKLLDFCMVGKRGKVAFKRSIWVCQVDVV